MLAVMQGSLWDTPKSQFTHYMGGYRVLVVGVDGGPWQMGLKERI